MRYIGGKSRIAKLLAPYIGSGNIYIEPFVGGGSVFAEVAPKFNYTIAADNHPDLMMMWRSLNKHGEPVTYCSEEEYNFQKTQPSSAWRGLVGFGQSFGGKWFGGYARGNDVHGNPRNYLAETVRNAMKIAPMMNHAVCADYRACDPPFRPRSTIYCDPPYRATQGYTTGQFDHDEFWNVMRQWSKNAKVLISEYDAPSDFKCVAEFPLRQQLALPEQGRDSRVERLWSYG